MARYTKVLKSLAHNAVGARRIESVITGGGGISALTWDAPNYRYVATNAAGTTVNGTSAQIFGEQLILSGSSGGGLKLYEGNSNGVHSLTVKAPDAVTADKTLTLPDGPPATSGYALVSTDVGVMSWAEFSGANFYADALTYVAGTTQKLTIGMQGTSDIVMTGDLRDFGQSIKLSGTNAGSIDLHEAGGSELVRIQAPATVTGIGQIYTLPDAYPASNGYALVSSTAGAMSWAPNSSANYYVTGGTYDAGNDEIDFTGVTGFPAFSVDTSAFAKGSLVGAANYVGYFTATNALTGTAGFQYDGTNISSVDADFTMSSATTLKPELTLTSTSGVNATNQGGYISFYRNDSTNPYTSTADVLGTIQFQNRNLASVKQSWADIKVIADDVTANNEISSIRFRTRKPATTTLQDTMTIYRDRVGIKTNTPAYQLDVVGTTQLSGNSSIVGTLTTTGVATLGNNSVTNTQTAGNNTTRIATTAFVAAAVAANSGTPAGSSTQLQYNNGGAFGGVDDWTWNGTDMTIATGSKLIFGDANRYIDEDGAHLRIRNSETGGNIDLNAKNLFRFYIDGAQKMSLSSAGTLTVSGNTTLQNPLIIETGSATKFNFKPDDQAEELLITGTKKTTAATEYAYYPRIVLDSDEDADALSQPGYPSVFFTKFGPTSIANPAGDPVGWRIAASGSAGIASAPQSLVWDYSSNQSTYSNKLILSEAGVLTATTFSGELAGTIASTTTATTQSAGNSTTKVATTAFVASAISGGGLGTVTSVAVAGNNGISVSGSPITSNGTITLGLSNLANSVLANSTVSYGGVSLALGATDATPAFDLTDATNYEGAAIKSTGEAGGSKFLREDGDGTSSWQAIPASSPGGSNTQVQYNNGGAFAGSANLTFASDILTVSGTTTLSDGEVAVSSGHLKVHSADDVNLDAHSGVTNFQYRGTETFRIAAGASSPVTLQPKASAFDLAMSAQDGTEVLRLDSANKRIGIGTTAPSRKLHVYSSDNMLANFESSGDTAMIRVSDNDTDGQIGVKDGKMFLGYSASMTTSNLVLTNVNSVVKVGIGNIAPTSHLDVTASDITALFGSDEGTNGALTNSTQKTARIGMPHYTNAEESVALLVSVSNASDNIIQYGGGAGTMNAATNHRFFTAANFNTTNGTERMRIDSGGNVGIGTTAPAVKLDVRDAGWPIAAFHGTSEYGTGIQLYNTHTTAQTWAILGGGTSQSNYPLKFYDQTNAVYRMVLDNTGKLGIGTTSPAYKLDVVGTTQLSGNTVITGTLTTTGVATLGNNSITNTQSAGNNTTRIATTEFVTTAVAGASATPGGSTTQIQYNDAGAFAGSANFTFNGTNQINLVPSNAEAKLQLGAGNVVLQYSGSKGRLYSANRTLRMGNTGAEIKMLNGTSDSIHFFTNGTSDSGTERMTILSGGNVGIGTSSPGAKLDVVSTSDNNTAGIRIGDGTNFCALYTDSGENFIIDPTNDFIVTGADDIKLQSNDDFELIGDDFVFVSGSTTMMRIAGAGSPTVGVSGAMTVEGTTTASGSMSLVNGAITSNPGANHLWASGATLFWGGSQIGTTTPGAGAIQGTATAGRVSYGDGSNSITSSANFTYTDSDNLTISSASANKPELLLKNTNAGDSPAFMTFQKDGGSAADGDEIGQIQFKGDDDGGSVKTYADMYVSSVDVSAGSEDASINFRAMSGGTLTGVMSLGYDGNGFGMNLFTASGSGLQQINYPNINNAYFAFGSDLTYSSGSATYKPAGFSTDGNPDPNDSGGDQQLAIFAQDDVSISAGNYGKNGGNDIVLRTTDTAASNPTTRMRIKGTGLIGIGTDNPSTLLDVVNTSSNWAMLIDQNNTGNLAMKIQGNYGLGISSEGQYALNMTTNGGGQVRFNDGGDFCIGTTSTANGALLHVEGDENLLANFKSTDGIAEIRIIDDTKYTRLLTVGSQYKIMPNDGVELMVLDGSANTVAVNGVISATAKSFNIPHPLYKDKRLVHGSLEGPEHAIYIRGTIETEEKGCLVELPEYWSAMCEDYTVQLTPHGPYTVYIKEKLKDKVMIECSQKKFKFDYYIVGARTDETLEVVQDG